MNKWVLRETLASDRLKKPIYFKSITDIGPCSTADPDEATRFVSKQEAMLCPAYVHPFSFYEPELGPSN